MIEIKINGESLNLYDNAVVRFELNSPLFKNCESSQIPGSYSFPFDIPITPENRKLLNYPDVIDNRNKFIKNISVEFCYCGMLFFNCRATVECSSDKRAKMFLITNRFDKLKNISLQDLDYEGLRFVNTPQISELDMAAHALETSLNPWPYDYIFFPVYNDCFFEDGTGADPLNTPSNYQNFFDINTSTYLDDPDQLIAMPFIKVSYIIERIFATCGIKFDDQFFSKYPELGNLTIYNNYSIYNEFDEWADFIDIKNHVPNKKADKFIQEFSKLFNLSFFTDPFSGCTELVAVKDFINLPAVKDWTHLSTCDYEICEDELFPAKFCFSECPDDKLDSGRKEHAAAIITQFDILQNTPGLYYEIWSNTYYNVVEHPGALFDIRRVNISRGKPCFDTGEDGATCEAEIQPLFMGLNNYNESDVLANWYTPEISLPGTLSHYNQFNNFPCKLMFYRGMHSIVNIPDQGDLYPLASSGTVGMGLINVGNYSINWVGEKGLYQNWWMPLEKMLNRNRVLKLAFCLKAPDLLNFSFKEKIIYENKEYFVKKMSISFTCKGLKNTNATLVDTL